MAELVDALVSGTSSCKAVQVRVLFRAQCDCRRAYQNKLRQNHIAPETKFPCFV